MRYRGPRVRKKPHKKDRRTPLSYHASWFGNTKQRKGVPREAAWPNYTCKETCGTRAKVGWCSHLSLFWSLFMAEKDWSCDTPPDHQIFFNKRLMAARHEEKCYENQFFAYVFVCKGLSHDDVGGANGHRIAGDTARSWLKKTVDFA